MLQLLAADAPNAEIARKLVLAVGTVKNGIRSRTQVSSKASDLRLL